MRKITKDLHKCVKKCRRILKDVEYNLGHRVPIKKRIGIVTPFFSRYSNRYRTRQTRNLRFFKFRHPWVQQRIQQNSRSSLWSSYQFGFQSRLQFGRQSGFGSKHRSGFGSKLQFGRQSGFQHNCCTGFQPWSFTTQSRSMISKSENQIINQRHEQRQKQEQRQKHNKIWHYLEADNESSKEKGDRLEKLTTLLLIYEQEQDSIYSKILWHNTGNADGGIDIIRFLKEKNQYGQCYDFIQCKNYKNTINNGDKMKEYFEIHKQYPSLRTMYIVTTSNFSEPLRCEVRDFNKYPLESHVTYMSHRSLQGAPKNPSEKMTETKLISTLLGQIDQRSITNGHFPYRIRKDNIHFDYFLKKNKLKKTNIIWDTILRR